MSGVNDGYAVIPPEGFVTVPAGWAQHAPEGQCPHTWDPEGLGLDWVCTRHGGHPGAHVAHLSTGTIVAVWTEDEQ